MIDVEAPIRGTTVGELLRHYRQRDGRSQAQLADDADLNHSYISRIERGERHPQPDALERIAKCLDLTAEEHHLLILRAGYLPENYDFDRIKKAQAVAIISRLHRIGIDIEATIRQLEAYTG